MWVFKSAPAFPVESELKGVVVGGNHEAAALLPFPEQRLPTMRTSPTYLFSSC